MKLEIREDSKNYACIVIKLPVKQKVEGLDNLVKITVFGNDILTKKDADENQLYLFFPVECAISQQYLSANNEFKNTNLNKNTNQKGYFEDNCRVKAIKFKGIISTGYLAPINTLKEVFTHRNSVGTITKFEDSYYEISQLKEGDEFTDIDGVNICKKYIIKHQHPKGGQFKEFKRFDKLVANQFRFHVDIIQLAKNIHIFHPEDIIVITDKFHGTSAVFANVLVRRNLNFFEKMCIFLRKYAES